MLMAQALERTSQLPAEAPQLLASMMKAASETPRVLRKGLDPCQDRVSALFAMAFEGIEAGLATALEEEKAKVASFEAKATELEKAVAEAEAAVEKHRTESKERRETLAKNSTVCANAQEQLISIRASHVAGQHELRRRNSEIEERLDAKKQVGDLHEAPQGEVQGELLSKLESFELNQSLLVALPSVALKPSSSRSSFESSVLQHVGDELHSQVESLRQEQGKLEAQAAEHDAADKAAVRDHETAQEQLRASSAAVTAAEAEQESSEAALKAAQQELANYEPERRKYLAQVEAAAGKLAGFRAGPLAAFRELHEPPAPAEAAFVAPEAVEPAAGEKPAAAEE